MTVMRQVALFFALGAVSCSTTWDAFRVDNVDACTNHPLDCGSGKVCSYQTRQCQPQSCRQTGLCWESPRPQLFQPRAIWGQASTELWLVGSRDIYRASGYVQQSRDEMEVLFTFLAERYERKSVLITSNLVFSEWNRIFKDPMTTAAVIDRLIHHAVILEMTGGSLRAEKAERTATISCRPTRPSTTV